MIDADTKYFVSQTDTNSFTLITTQDFKSDTITIQIETCKFTFHLEVESKYLNNNNLELYIYKNSHNINQATLAIVNLAVKLPLNVIVLKRKVRCTRWIKQY